MLIFLFIVFAYGFANLYLFFKLSSLISSGIYADVLIGAAVLFMTISPVLIPVYSHSGPEKNIRIFSYIGYMWLAFLVPFFPFSVLLDLYNYTVPLAGEMFNGNLNDLVLSPASSFIVPLIFSLAVIAWGYIEARNLRAGHLTFRTPKLSSGRRVRIAQISDLHLGVIVGDRTLRRVAEIMNREKPDIIVSTGDLVDGSIKHIDHLPDMLKELHAPGGKFAVVGNHEIYGGLSRTTAFIRDAGFTLLRGEGVTINNSVNIAGMDFSGGEARSHTKNTKQKPAREVLSALPPGLFTVLLKHRSDVDRESLGLFDLQLSGHTHRGQIFPMNLATMFIFPHHTGFTELGKGSAIYTSRGTGTAGPPVRFLSPPEVTIIDVVGE